MTIRVPKPLRLLLAVPLALASGMPQALAQGVYPTRPVRVVVSTSAASGTDTVARLIAQPLAERLGQQVVVENRAGAATMIGTEIVARSAPDGYTLLMSPPALTINPAMYKKLPYEAQRDFAPITHAISTPLVITVHPSLPVKSVKELIALAKARPGEIAFAHSGSGSITHLAMVTFLVMTGTHMLPVAYKGPAPGMIDLMAGRVSIQALSAVAVVPHIRSEKLRALGVTTARRVKGLTEVPTIAEAGVPGYEVVSWAGLLAPAKTPKDVIARLHKETTSVLRMQDVSERISRDGSEVVASSPDELGAFLRAETAKWAKFIKSAGIEPE